MPYQLEPRKALAQFCQKPLCFVTMLESSHEIVGKANEDYLPVRLLLSSLLDPEVEYIVQMFDNSGLILPP